MSPPRCNRNEEWNVSVCVCGIDYNQRADCGAFFVQMTWGEVWARVKRRVVVLFIDRADSDCDCSVNALFCSISFGYSCWVCFRSGPSQVPEGVKWYYPASEGKWRSINLALFGSLRQFLCSSCQWLFVIKIYWIEKHDKCCKDLKYWQKTRISRFRPFFKQNTYIPSWFWLNTETVLCQN